MASFALFMKLLCVGLAGMLAFAPEAEAVIGCNQVFSDLEPCLSYISGGTLSAGCCPGIKALLQQSSTTADRRSVCGCLKTLASSYPGNIGKAQKLVGTCGVHIPYSLSPSTDCAKVK